MSKRKTTVDATVNPPEITAAADAETGVELPNLEPGADAETGDPAGAPEAPPVAATVETAADEPPATIRLATVPSDDDEADEDDDDDDEHYTVLQVVLRKERQVGDNHRPAGSVLADVRLHGDCSLNYLVDAVRNGLAGERTH
jgi:hypothetical protein